VNEGDVAPDFELPDQDGNPVTLSGQRGRRVVLPDYQQADAVVLGVSPDPVATVKRFHDKQGLNFTLLADEDHAVADRYGVWVEKSRYGKTFWGVERTTFLLDEEGRLTGVLRKVKPEEHDRLVLDALGAAA
jgi:thioredoxin-dependent peroxiredoxin